MIEIRPLEKLNTADLTRLISGYTSHSKYAVTYSENAAGYAITLQQIQLDEPYIKKWHPNDNDLTRYRRLLTDAYSFGAYAGDLLVGIAITEPREWNKSLWIWEFHVEGQYQGQGIGRRLMDVVAEKGKTAGFRTIVCEVQSTNGRAINIYHKLGFRVEGIDISYYSNEDYPDGEIALLMKRPL